MMLGELHVVHPTPKVDEHSAFNFRKTNQTGTPSVFWVATRIAGVRVARFAGCGTANG